MLGLTDERVAQLCQQCPRLTALDLSYSAEPDLMDEALVSAARHLPDTITNLRLPGCPRFSDRGALALAAGCTGLTSLNLRGGTVVMGAGRAALQALPHLWNLTLSDP